MKIKILGSDLCILLNMIDNKYIIDKKGELDKSDEIDKKISKYLIRKNLLKKRKRVQKINRGVFFISDSSDSD